MVEFVGWVNEGWRNPAMLVRLNRKVDVWSKDVEFLSTKEVRVTQTYCGYTDLVVLSKTNSIQIMWEDTKDTEKGREFFKEFMERRKEWCRKSNEEWPPWELRDELMGFYVDSDGVCLDFYGIVELHGDEATFACGLEDLKTFEERLETEVEYDGYRIK